MGRRSSRRAELLAERQGGFALLPTRQIKLTRPPVEVLSSDQVETIHRASLKVLAEGGIRFLSDEARRALRLAGAAVDDGSAMVRFDPALVEELVAKAPAEVTLSARNPEKDITFGDASVNFGSVNGPSFCSDLEKGRRPGNFEDLANFLKLVQMLGVVAVGGGSPVEPLDRPVPTRHLDRLYACLTLQDKVFPSSLLGRVRARDALEMVALSRGLALEEIKDRPLLYGGINTNSPRQIDIPMAEGLMTLAEYGQPVIVTPFTLLGAMAPATLAGALTLQNAEALAGICLAQATNPGTPVGYGGFTSNVDMKSGAPAFGTPEYAKACQATGQLTRRYGLPYRSSSTNASNCVDAQAAWETQMSLWGAVLGGAHLVNHGVGWLEGGLTTSFEKLIIDAEMLQMMAEYLEPIATDSDALALEAIREVPPGGHFFGAAHTLERYETAFYDPLVADWRNYETWEEDGARNATERAHLLWKEMLAAYEEPPIDPGIKEALEAYVARRKLEIEKDPEGL